MVLELKQEFVTKSKIINARKSKQFCIGLKWLCIKTWFLKMKNAVALIFLTLIMSACANKQSYQTRQYNTVADRSGLAPNEQLVGYATGDGYEIKLVNSACPFSDMSKKYPLKFVAKQLSDGQTASGCYSYNAQSQEVNLVVKGKPVKTVPAGVFVANTSGQAQPARQSSFLEALGGALTAIGGSAQQASAQANAGVYNAAAGNNRAVVVGGDGSAIQQKGRFNNQPNADCVTTMNGMQVTVPCKY